MLRGAGVLARQKIPPRQEEPQRISRAKPTILRSTTISANGDASPRKNKEFPPMSCSTTRLSTKSAAFSLHRSLSCSTSPESENAKPKLTVRKFSPRSSNITPELVLPPRPQKNQLPPPKLPRGSSPARRARKKISSRRRDYASPRRRQDLRGHRPNPRPPILYSRQLRRESG